jgi:Zn-dependent M28 family amino/carboxypeptidase
MFLVPGHSHRGPLPELTEAERTLSKHLSDHVWMLAGEIGARSLTKAPENLKKAANYIEHSFRTYGYAPERQDYSIEIPDPKFLDGSNRTVNFPTVQHTPSNIIVEKTGTAEKPGIIIVGAHYDSVYDCPAANDNGSGVAAMLEIARALRHEAFSKTLRFVAFTNEEPPFAMTEQMGSYQYAARCRNAKENIAAMISLETLGYYTDTPNSQKFPHPSFGLMFPNTGNFTAFISNLQSVSLLRKCVGSFRKSVKFPSEGLAAPRQIRGVDFSDQYYFWDFGYPGLMVTDTAFLRYPHYHELEDTPDKLDYDKIARVVTGLTAVVRDLCAS